MPHDLVIRGGDGGRRHRRARRAPRTWPSTATASPRSATSAPAAATIDADGALVTPGFVDIHTHYDGQATWDERMTPSSWHGVTTVVIGQLRRRLRAGAPRATTRCSSS